MPSNETNSNITSPTAAPQQSSAEVPDTPVPAPTPAASQTHEPTKKYEPEEEKEEEEEKEKHSEFAKKAFISIGVILGVGALCYFRDAITFFLGSVSACETMIPSRWRLLCLLNVFLC